MHKEKTYDEGFDRGYDLASYEVSDPGELRKYLTMQNEYERGLAAGVELAIRDQEQARLNEMTLMQILGEQEDELER